MDKLISQQAAINVVSEITTTMSVCTNKDECYGMKRMQKQAITELANLPSVQPDLDEWCTDCKEYDSNKHCCPRFSRVIREALKEAQPKVIVLCADCIKRDKCKFYDTQGDGGYCRYGRDKDGRFNPQTAGD